MKMLAVAPLALLCASVFAQSEGEKAGKSTAAFKVPRVTWAKTTSIHISHAFRLQEVSAEHDAADILNQLALGVTCRFGARFQKVTANAKECKFIGSEGHGLYSYHFFYFKVAKDTELTFRVTTSSMNNNTTAYFDFNTTPTEVWGHPTTEKTLKFTAPKGIHVLIVAHQSTNPGKWLQVDLDEGDAQFGY